MGKNTKVDQMIEKALEMKQTMNAMEKAYPEVRQYNALDNDRRKIHSQIKDHLKQYPNTDRDRPGLVSSWNESISIKAIRKLFQKVGSEEITTLSEVVSFLKGEIKGFWRVYTR